MRDPYGGRDWAGQLVGLVLALILLLAALQLIVAMVKSLLPWIGLGVLIFVASTLWRRHRERW